MEGEKDYQQAVADIGVSLQQELDFCYAEAKQRLKQDWNEYVSNWQQAAEEFERSKELWQKNKGRSGGL